MHTPCQVYWESALKVLAYCKYAHKKELIYRKHGSLYVEAYSNVGYAVG